MNRLEIVEKYMTLKNLRERPHVYLKAAYLKRRIIAKESEMIRWVQLDPTEAKQDAGERPEDTKEG